MIAAQTDGPAVRPYHSKHLILATAGHVDHGKTALIKALTGTDTDRLPEEKARGITIELGFAHLQLGDVSLGIVDVPGHEDFIKNVVAGVASIDIALLVIAADDGWMPQTEEHLQILEYLGVSRAVIAVTKTDLAPAPTEAIRLRLAGTAFADAVLVSVSTKTGAGLDELRAQLARECNALPSQRDIGKPRLAVDRAFTLQGIGLVVTGTLTGGKLQRGVPVVVQPHGRTGRIRAVQNHGREVEASEAGMRTALSIPGIEANRGDVITRPDCGGSSSVIDVLVERSARLPLETRPIKQGAIVRVHHGTASSSARIFFVNDEPLRAGATAIAQLRFDGEIFAFVGDRFLLRDSSERQTMAGALVLDADAVPPRFRTAAQQEFLAARAAAPRDAAVFVRTQLRRDRVADRASLLVKSHFSVGEIERAAGEATIAGDFICDPAWWNDVRAHAALVIDAEHKAHPNRIGLELPRLRDSLGSTFSARSELFAALIADLCANGFLRSNETIHRKNHRPTLPAALQTAGTSIRTALATRPFDPPSRKELASNATSEQALRFLRDTGEVVDISPDVVVLRSAVEEMRTRIAERLRANGGATVSELRQVLGSSRRVVVPLLEYFDAAGVTRRIGDKRVLRLRS